MKVEIDLDELILKAAVLQMDENHWSEYACLGKVLKELLPEDANLLPRLRQQVKEYKKLTMWRDWHDGLIKEAR